MSKLKFRNNKEDNIEQRIADAEETTTESLVEVAEESKSSLKKKLKEDAVASSILERLNAPTKNYKRVGVDIIAEIDEEIEHIANNILKDKASKKDIYNEALALGFPIWKKKLTSLKNNI